jgi:anti-sigma regulatory factor (Ser/Thr protein kinase)
LVPVPAAAAVPSAFVATLPAAATTSWLVRERFTTWLAALGWPVLAVEDVVFAVSEAVSNCAEHAYPPGTPDAVVEISAVVEPAPAGQDQRADPDAGDGHGQRESGQHRADARYLQTGQRLRIQVRDHGTWRPVPPDPSYRGRGLQMMIALMRDVVIHHSDTGRSGTEITLVSPTVVPAP